MRLIDTSLEKVKEIADILIRETRTPPEATQGEPMPKFVMIVSRERTESATVRVFAETLREAQKKALTAPELYADTDNKGRPEWQLDDLPYDCEPYIGDPDGYELED